MAQTKQTMPQKDKKGCNITIFYRNGEVKVIGPFNVFVADFMAIIITLKPHVLMVKVEPVND